MPDGSVVPPVGRAFAIIFFNKGAQQALLNTNNYYKSDVRSRLEIGGALEHDLKFWNQLHGFQ
jgi:hypothetical protein